MSFTEHLVRSIAGAIQREAIKHASDTEAWAIFQDAADALNDLADWLGREHG